MSTTIAIRSLLLASILLVIIFMTLEGARRTHNLGLDTAQASRSSVGEDVRDQSKEARILSAQDLLVRPLATNMTTVPKLLHQSWSTSTLPVKFERWSRSCREPIVGNPPALCRYHAHPDWEWVLWTDQDNLDLVRIYAPWFLPTYEALEDRMPVYRADIVRNLYMHVFGGVYADLDIECLQPSDTLFEKYSQPGRQLFIGRMGLNNNSRASLPNAWFASTPGHPFWVLPLEFVESNINEIDTAEGLSGPGALFDIVKEYEDKYTGDEMDNHYAQSGWRNLFPKPVQILSDPLDQTLTILPHWEIYPYSWEPVDSPYQHFCWTRAELFDERVCKSLLGTADVGSHTITYWSHSWGEDGGGHDANGLKSVSEGQT